MSTEAYMSNVDVCVIINNSYRLSVSLFYAELVSQDNECWIDFTNDMGSIDTNDNTTENYL